VALSCFSDTLGFAAVKFKIKGAQIGKRIDSKTAPALFREKKGVDLKDLKFFVAVYEAKGFSSASKSLGTVQSNVSARIIALERKIGTALFERRWRSVVPTPKADKFYSYAKDVIAKLNDGESVFEASNRARS